MFPSTDLSVLQVIKSLNGFINTSVVPYIFGYNNFLFQNKSKNLGPSYKMDLDLWDYFGREKLILQQNFI